MKVLHIISSGGMYGAESVILNLSHALREASHHSELGVFSNTANPNLQLHTTALEQRIKSSLLACNGQVDGKTIQAIRELVARAGADVVHAHGYKADIYCYLALRDSPTPYVSTCHNWLKQNWMVSLYGMADRMVLRKYARVVAVSDEVRQRLLNAGVRNDRIRMVRNGIDLRPYTLARPVLSRGEPALLVGFVGRLSYEKGADIFLAAVARVLAEFPDARFVVVGEGPDSGNLEQTIDDLKIRSSVQMLGRRNDMPSVYASFDIMVSASRQEGLPMAILEGMASSLPLVATAVGEVPTIVLDENTGLLVPPENVEKLAAAILDLLCDPAKRARLGAAARQLIENQYSAERMAAEYLQVYEEAITAAKQEHAK
jgi:glycosyltransferase involved in cell wall biosynthesis